MSSSNPGSSRKPSFAPATLDRLREVIESAVAKVFAVPVEALMAPSRGRARIALARQVAMYLAHIVGRLPLTDVGRVFGRDRTTVSHACSVIEDRRDNPSFNHMLDLLEGIVKQIRSIMALGADGFETAHEVAA